MSGQTPMERIADIDQQIAELQSDDAARSAVDSIRDDLGSVKDYFRKTTDDIGSAKDRIEKELEAASEGSHTAQPEITSEEVKKFLDNVAEDDSGLDKWIEDRVKAAEGLYSDFTKAGDPTPDELDEEISDFKGEFTEELEDWLKGAGKASSGLKEILENKRVKEFTDGVQGGLESSGNVLGGVTEGLEEIDGILQWFQTVDDLTSTDAQTQLNALGEAFDGVVDSLGGSVTLIPGLGAFFHLYGEAFRGAATSAATIAASRDHYNDIFQIVDEGKYLYLTSDALLQLKIAKLEEERAELLEHGLDAAYEERTAREDAEAAAGGKKDDYDVAVELGFRAASSQQPLRTPAYIAWKDSSTGLAAAKDGLETARVNLMFAREHLAEAEVRAEHAQDKAAAQAQIESAQGEVNRAQDAFNAASHAHTEAAETHRDATSAFRAENEAFNDVVRANVIKQAARTHGGKGFTDDEWVRFNRDYPQYEVTPAHLESVLAKPDPDADDAAGSVAAGAVIGGAAAPAIGTKKNRRMLIGAGGALGGLLLIGAIFILPNLGSDGEIKAGETTSSTQAEAPTDSTADEPTAGDSDACTEAPNGCTDYGQSIFATGSIVWEPGGSCPSTPSDVAAVGVNPSSTGWRVFIPGYGGCKVGDDGVTCPGQQERGQRESNGVVTVIGETLEVTEVLDNGFKGVAEDWTASPDADGNADMSTADCTNGGTFVFTTDPEPWQSALASPIAEESPMSLGNFACYLVPSRDGVLLVFSLQAELAAADPPTPFEMSLEARLGSWVTVPTEVLGVIDPSESLGMTTVDPNGNLVTPAAYGGYQNGVDALASFLSEVLADGVDPYSVIEELGLDPNDPEGALETLKQSNLVGIFGAYAFSPDNSEEEAAALEGFGPDALVDAAGVLRNGRFAAFAPSVVCGS